jgi:serine protease Do
MGYNEPMKKFTKMFVLAVVLLVLSSVVLTACIDFSVFSQGGGGGGGVQNPGGGAPNIGDNLDNVVTIETVVPNITGTLPQIIESVRHSVVVIEVKTANGTSAGSGVVVASTNNTNGSPNHSYIITNHHVVEGAQTITVRFTDGSKAEAQFIGGVHDHDVAALRVTKTGLTKAQVRNTNEQKGGVPLMFGETAIAIGNPLGTLGGTVTKGIISGLEREINVEGTLMTLLQTDAAINRGNSGGGLFDETGALIGIIVAKAVGDSVEGIGFAIPIELAINLFQDLVNTANDPDNQFGGFGYIPNKFMLGVMVETVAFNSGVAYRIVSVSNYGTLAGMVQANDRIIAINDEPFTNNRTLANVLSGLKIGDEIRMCIRRGSGNAATDRTENVLIRQFVYGFDWVS